MRGAVLCAGEGCLGGQFWYTKHDTSSDNTKCHDGTRQLESMRVDGPTAQRTNCSAHNGGPKKTSSSQSFGAVFCVGLYSCFRGKFCYVPTTAQRHDGTTARCRHDTTARQRQDDGMHDGTTTAHINTTRRRHDDTRQ